MRSSSARLFEFVGSFGLDICFFIRAHSLCLNYIPVGGLHIAESISLRFSIYNSRVRYNYRVP